jgi:hypothetical protein
MKQYRTYLDPDVPRCLISIQVVLGGLVVIVLATKPKVRWFKPCPGLWTYKGDKNSYHDFICRRIKTVGPMQDFKETCGV